MLIHRKSRSPLGVVLCGVTAPFEICDKEVRCYGSEPDSTFRNEQDDEKETKFDHGMTM
jgi:hypothetical protein